MASSSKPTSSPCSTKKSTTFCTSVSETKAPCTLIGFGSDCGEKSISPLPKSFSAPTVSSIVRESIPEETAKAILEGIFAFISPVITFTLGLCVAITKCIPQALASCASLHIASSTSFCATIIRSASSSMIISICGNFSKSGSMVLNLSL